jgi:hypothetical protein
MHELLNLTRPESSAVWLFQFSIGSKVTKDLRKVLEVFLLFIPGSEISCAVFETPYSFSSVFKLHHEIQHEFKNSSSATWSISCRSGQCREGEETDDQSGLVFNSKSSVRIKSLD